MDAKDYCRSMEMELNAWKAKMYDMVREVGKLRSGEKENLSSNVDALHNQIKEMERIIDGLRTECPIDFSPQKKEIDQAGEELKSKYDDAMAAILQF